MTYPERIAELERELHEAYRIVAEVRRHNDTIADSAEVFAKRILELEREVSTLRFEATQLMAENANHILALDSLRTERAWLKRNAVEQAERIRELEAEGERKDEAMEVREFEAYQIIGNIADRTGLFEHPEVTRALDWFAYPDDRPEEIFPWPNGGLDATPTGQHDLPPTRAEEQAESAFYTAEETAVHRQQLRDGHAAARAEVVRHGVKLHPRIEAQRIANEANEEREG